MRRGTERLGSAYWRLWWANAVSTVGDGVFVTALPLLAVTITKSPELISLVAVASYAPWLLVSLPAGVLVDRYDRGRLMSRAQIVQGAVVVAITVLVAAGGANIALLALAGFVLGSAEVVFANAAQSILPRLVRPDQLARANGNQYVVQTTGQMFIGPPAGSVLFAVMRALPFGLDAGSFALSAALLARLPAQPPHPAPAQAQSAQSAQASAVGPAPGGAAPAGLFAGIREGLDWLFRHRLLRLVGVLLGVNNFFGQMGMATMVLLATQTLHVGVRGYGLLLSAMAVGSVTGGLVNPVLARRIGQLPSLIIASAANAAIYLGIGQAADMYMAAALFAANGFAVTMWNVATVTLRQQIVPDELRGRVNSAYRMLGWGLIPLGALTGGFVAQTAGLRAPYTIAGIMRGVVLLALIPALIAAGRHVPGLTTPHKHPEEAPTPT